jgi:hypothetical protein
MTDTRMHTYGYAEADPGSGDPELALRAHERREAFTLLAGAVSVAYPDLLSSAPITEQPNVAAPADTVAQFSATAALSQQVDGLRL